MKVTNPYVTINSVLQNYNVFTLETGYGLKILDMEVSLNDPTHPSLVGQQNNRECCNGNF